LNGWLDGTFAYARQRHETYYEDSIGLLCMLAMSHRAWAP
jgi:hypothetical protein